MKKNELVRNVMTKNIVTVNLTEPFSAAKQKMDSLNVHHMPVLDGQKLVGMISRVDILKYSYNKAYHMDAREESASLDHNLTIDEIMTKELVLLSENDTVRTAVGILANNGFNSLPIVNSDNELLGLITSKDLLGYFLEQY